MRDLSRLLNWRRLLPLAIVAILAGAPVACSDMFGSPSSKNADCHKSKRNVEC